VHIKVGRRYGDHVPGEVDRCGGHLSFCQRNGERVMEHGDLKPQWAEETHREGDKDSTLVRNGTWGGPACWPPLVEMTHTQRQYAFKIWSFKKDKRTGRWLHIIGVANTETSMSQSRGLWGGRTNNKAMVHMRYGRFNS